MMIGYIISAKTGKLTNFDKRYEKNAKLLSAPGVEPTDDEVSNIVKKFNNFLDVIDEIGDGGKVFGKSTKGLKARKPVSPLWMWVADPQDYPSREKIIHFYKKMGADDSSAGRLKSHYMEKLSGGGNNELSKNKIKDSLKYIHEAVLQEA